MFNLKTIRMATPTYAERISDAQVMAAGLKNNASQIARRGLDAAFIAELEADRTDAAALNDQQEKLKSDLKQKSADLEAKLAELDKKMAEAKKVVKMDFPKEQWAQFGITDKH